MKAIFFFLAATLSIASAHAAQDSFKGEYSQLRLVRVLDERSEQSCVSNGNQWNGFACYQRADNTVSVVKLSDVAKTYFVQISTAINFANEIHTCDFNEEMKKVGSNLVYRERGCGIVMSKNKLGTLVVKVRGCEEDCGTDVSLTGTNGHFKKVSAGETITRSQENN
jgi:hypothetical protein